MEILKNEYLEKYKKRFRTKINYNLDKINSGSSENNFEYYLISSAVFSSNIEGNSIDLNSFMNSRMQKKKIKTKEFAEIEDLILAYNFAKKNNLTEKNLLKTHELISEKILIKSKRGKYREEKIGVFDFKGLVYMAIEPEFVIAETSKIFKDIEILNNRSLETDEVFYYASLIHLVFAHIHPFMDGNGRAARLLEKWFISIHLGEIAWKIRSEKYYFENRIHYYENINLGPDYYALDYEKCFPFLEMLSKSLE